MNNQKEVQTELSDVLDEIQMSGSELSPDEVNKWTKEYPQFTEEIREFAAFEAVNKHIPDREEPIAPEVSAKRFEAVREIVRSAVATRQKTGEEASRENLTSIAARAKKQGLRFPELAKKIGLSLPILANLEQRFVKLRSVPPKIIERIAENLKVSSEAVKNYLEMPPQMTTQANFKATDNPEMPEQQDFFELVRNDRMLTAEQKEEILKLRE